ncbi:TolC family protein [Paraburkholderia bannensis]|uniref:TolC family protein n=1 Tax=Paraburkholderia bannensis TaxID=765414 RepID=UPI000A01F591
MSRATRFMLLAAAWLMGTAHAADLLSVVSGALERDPALAASREATRAAAQAAPKARAALLPRVSGGWGRAYNGIVTEDFPTQHYWQSGWTIGLTQPVFNWANWTAYRQADYVVARARLQAASAQQDAILSAAQAYFDALAATDEVARATDYLHAIDAHMALLARGEDRGRGDARGRARRRVEPRAGAIAMARCANAGASGECGAGTSRRARCWAARRVAAGRCATTRAACCRAVGDAGAGARLRGADR